MEVEKGSSSEENKQEEIIHSVDEQIVSSVELPEKIEEAVTDEHLRKTALESANQLYEFVSKNWFTPFDVFQKLKVLSLDECIAKLNALKLFGVVYERIINGEKKYKVTLNDVQRLELLDNDIQFYTTKVEILKKERIKLEEKISSNITKE